MVRLQLLDADYIIADNKPIIRLFCKTDTGRTACVFSKDFRPYFYVYGDNEKIVEVLNKKYSDRVHKIQEAKKFFSIGYTARPTHVLKVFTNVPSDVPFLRDELFEKYRKIVKKIFEADILFKYRFMVDNGLAGMCWFDVVGGKQFSKTVKCPIIEAKTIKPVREVKNAPLKYLSFDIEAISYDYNRMVDEKRDPIVMISMAFAPSYRGKKTLVLVAKQGAREKDVENFSSEKEMLERFLAIIDDFDPDVLTGYNIINFDIPYILERLGRNNLPKNFGRITDKPCFVRKFGAYQTCTVVGRVVVDPYQIIKADPFMRFKRYDLNTVALEMLGDGKIDVGYKEMVKLWNGSSEKLSKFIRYSRKDADLALKILLNTDLLGKFFELSKVSGLLLQDSLGGQSARVETSFLRACGKRDFVIPTKPSKAEIIKRETERQKKGLKGATVLEPKKGLHADGCVLVLDFKSLYPSLIRTFNICPTCLITKDSPTNVKKHKTPSGSYFVDETVRRGILPSILENLLETRFAIKKKMKKASGEEARVLNAKQLALKIMANSFYGYTGYLRARLYVMDVANSITAYGRENIQKTKKIIEENFPVEVIYGDTDSIFLKTDITNLDKAAQLGKRISKYVTEHLPGYLELEFEKVYRTFLILTKKRYAGWKFVEVEGKWKDSIDMRGIETVRRDWCQLVTDVMNHILELILRHGDVKKAIDYVKTVLLELRQGKVPLEKLTIIKGITKTPSAYKGVLPHIELAKKLYRRDPVHAPPVGGRIGFVIIKGNQMLSKRAEDPEYAKKHGLLIDSKYYIENQVLPPVARILSAVGVSSSELLGGGQQVSLSDAISGKKRKLNHKISLEYSGSSKREEKPLDSWEEFVCSKCKKSYRRMPLTGRCECGGELLIAYHGSVSRKVRKQAKK